MLRQVEHLGEGTARWSGEAFAHPNIALVKYWGKRDDVLNLPAVPSLSITLDALVSHARVRPRAVGGPAADEIWLDGRTTDGAEGRRLGAFVDLVLGPPAAGRRPPLSIECANNFPTGAGLASSASGFAALALALDQAGDLRLSAADLGVLARRGSGSATRSLCGGFVRWPMGERDDGLDSFASTLVSADHWPLEVAVVVLSSRRKPVSSREGMTHCRATSPAYAAWVAGGEADLLRAEKAIGARNFLDLAEVAEESFQRMHATMRASQPTLDYWTADTWTIIRKIADMRESGVPVFATSDAGPQVKAVCAPGWGRRVADVLASEPCVQEVRLTGLGRGAWRGEAAA